MQIYDAPTHMCVYTYIYIYTVHILTHTHIYDHSCTADRRLQLSRFMSQALTTGVSTGTSLALLWKVLEGVQLQPPPFVCPVRSPYELHFPSLCAGLLLGIGLGLVLGPICEGISCLRSLILQATLRRVLGWAGQSPAQRPLFRLV